MSTVSFSGASMALQIAALEVETTNQQQEADKASRDASRHAKLAEMKAEEDTLREKAGELMREAVVGGALKIGAGAATFAAGCNDLEAAHCDNEAGFLKEQGTADASAIKGLKDQALDAKDAANNWKLVASGAEGGALVSEGLSNARSSSLDADAAQHRRQAQQAENAAEDKADQIRRREDQFAQKLSVLEDTLRSSRETERMIIRG
jgi:protein required for attachment to host cells